MTLSIPALLELEPSWREALEKELNEPYLVELMSFVEGERQKKTAVYPPKHLVFNALNTTPFADVSVVILGQDPYHGKGQAHGLSFSVPRGMKSPPSLQNIFKELEKDLKIAPSSHGCLLSWAKQGVLLLNTTLTVREKEPMSHAGRGWERFTCAVLQALIARQDPVIFVLWGAHAQKTCPSTEGTSHVILQSPHPSPFSASRGFFGCGHFSKINEQLKKWGKTPIKWDLNRV